MTQSKNENDHFDLDHFDQPVRQRTAKLCVYNCHKGSCRQFTGNPIIVGLMEG